jgi:hypothetical protein
MKHAKVNVSALARRLKRAAGGRSPTEIAKLAKVDVSRVTRFLNGDFKKMTPVLRRFCGSLRVPLKEFVLDSPASALPPEMLASWRRIVGQDSERAQAAGRLLRSLEVLAAGNRRAGQKD